jgi:MoaA/NifB/PqqE/SkfB family radical SAM enzyme
MRKVSSYSLPDHQLQALPVVVLMPHSRCNCRCVMCDIWKANAQRQELGRDDLAPHVEAFRRLGVRHVALSGGEALMHSNLWALCELLAEIDIELSLLSTGLLLRRNAGEIVRFIDEVIVSLDGPRDVHDAIRRVPRAYEKLADGVAALRELAPDFVVTGRSVVQRGNFRHLSATVEAAHDIGLDRLSFLAVDVATTAFNRATPWDEERVAEVALVPGEIAELEEGLERLFTLRAADFRDGFLVESPEKLRRIPRHFAAQNGDGPPLVPRCNAPWVSAVIDADGAVRPCFFHPPYGNLHERRFDEVVRSPEAIAFRRQLDVERDPICQGCVCTLYLEPSALST